MALYTFRCDTCGEFQSIISMQEMPKTRLCPKCGQPSPRIFDGHFQWKRGVLWAANMILEGERNKPGTDHTGIAT